jgi:septal ring factor EnvC (AmiA/AmiB activator)
VRLNKGLLYQTTKVREEKTYNLKNRTEKDRTVLIEHPYRPEFALVSKDKPSERARDVYRFEVKLPAGKNASREVIEEQDVATVIALTNSDDNQMRFFISQPVVSEAVKQALSKAVELKSKVTDTARELAQLQKQLKDITDDQVRLRANLREMPQTAEAYKRYLKKFDEQETQIEDLQKKIKALQDSEFAHRKAFEDYLAKLDAE